MARLTGKLVAILATDGFEEIELLAPRRAIEEAGGACEIVSLANDPIQGFHEFDRAGSLPVDRTVAEADASRYAALLLPGGTINADKLRAEPDVSAFVAAFFAAGKPVAAICHAPWLLIDAGVARGRALTSFRTLRRDLENAGARWRDAEVVVDGALVTSRDPRDLPAFNARMVEVFA